MYQTTYLNEGAQARVQNRNGGEGHTEETTTAREQNPVQTIHVEKREQSKRRYRAHQGNVRPETQSEGSTYFLPPFFLLPCCFDFAAGPSALPLPFALDFASLAAWVLAAFFFPVVAALPFFPFSFLFFPADFFPPGFDNSCQKGFQKWRGQRKVASTVTQKRVEGVTHLPALQVNLLGKIAYHLLKL